MASRLVKVFNGEDLGYTPVWLMRQAGRYLPEYLELRAKYPDFWQRCKNPELAAEITLQPIRRFELDAAIVFSDILTIPDACGHPVTFVPGQGPVIKNPINSLAQVDALPEVGHIDSIDYIYKALKLVRRELDADKTLIGFAGSPWTVATYMLEGGKSAGHLMSRQLAYGNPELVAALIKRLTAYTIRYLSNQIKAGAEIVQIFDTWGSLLAADAYQRFALAPLTEIVSELKSLHPGVPVIVFGKGVNHQLSALTATKADGYSIDWTISCQDARQHIPYPLVLQGNLDPALLHTDRKAIKAAVDGLFSEHVGGIELATGSLATGSLANSVVGAGRLLDKGARRYFIANLGHGIVPGTDPDLVKYLVDCIHEVSSGLL